MTKSSRSNKSSALDEQKKHRTGRRDAVPSAPHTRTLAKLSRPRLFQALSRERLFGLLDAAVERPLVYIAAEPGAGKTTLLASYLGDRRIAALWYRVDEGDGDIATFFYFIRQAAERMHGGDAGLPLLTPEYAEDLEGFSRRFFRILFAALPQSCVLAFDNMHTVAAAAELHRVLAAAAAETPDGAAIVCLSRTEPAPAYATLFANGLAARINAETLKLTEKETASLVSRRNGLDDDAARLLHTRTGGWAAGVCLLAEAWERDPGITGSLGKVTVQQVGRLFRDRDPAAPVAAGSSSADALCIVANADSERSSAPHRL